jgi:hypothetical protein
MKTLYLILIFILVTLETNAQAHFTKYKPAKYKTVPIQGSSLLDDSTKFDVIDFSKIPTLQGIKIYLRHIKGDSSTILIYKKSKLVQTITFSFWFWLVENDCFVADLDNNKKTDIKLTIEGGGAGLAGELAHKIYLFNYGNKFKMLTFFDFSHEKEYDINNDGVFEILGCNHVFNSGHSYWVYNAFNFVNGRLKNVSKTVGYPLWTKHLYKSSNIIATNVSKKDRIKEFRELPDETIIK